MNKKFLSLVLALVMVLGTLTPVFAEEAAPKDKIEKAAKTAPSAKVQWLVDEKIVSGRKLFKDGDEKTDLSLDKNLQRDEITRLLVLGKGLENLANLVQGTMRPYVDVDNSNWANGVITVGSYHLKNAQGVPMLAGYPGNKFLPTRNVSYAELAKMLVCLVDNSITPKMVENFQWPSDWMVRAANLGILAGVDVKDSKAFVTRQAAFEMLYNALYLYDTAHHVDYGTKMGVVSGYANGELKINQGEKAFTVKLNGSTLYVNNSGYVGENALRMWNSNQGLWVGSLVRVIADKDGNATHIVELGNPSVGAIDGRWFGVADKTVQGFADFKLNNAKDAWTLTVKSNTWMNQTDLKAYLKDNNFKPVFPSYKTDIAINLTSNTRYFVADPARNYLTEVDNATARKLVDKVAYGHELKDIPNVYVGYDELAKGIKGRETNEARVVVFNVVNKTFKDDVTVRVTNPSNRTYNFYAENTKGEVTEYSLAKYAGAMPGFERPNGLDNTNTAGYRSQFEKFNVLALDLNKDTKEVFRTGLLIDYNNDPAFRVRDLKLDHGQYILLDVEGKEGVKTDIRVDLDRTSRFLEGQWNPAAIKGKYIQFSKLNAFDAPNYHVNAKGEVALETVISGAISILDTAPKFAKLQEGTAQFADRVKVTITSDPESLVKDGQYFIRAEKLVFHVENDKALEKELNERFKTYNISNEDANRIIKTREAYQNAELTFAAEVIDKNSPSGKVMLRLGELLAPEMKGPKELVLAANFPTISDKPAYSSERGKVEQNIRKANGLDKSFDNSMKFAWDDKGVTVTHPYMRTRTFKNEEVARAPYEYKVTFVVPNGTLTIGTTKYEPNPTEAVGVLKVLETANKVTTLPTAVPNENTKTFKQWTIKGTADKFDATTEVTKDITVVAEWN